MNDKFEVWLKEQLDKGLKDIKFVLGGGASNASVNSAKSEIIRLHKMAKAGITTDSSKAPDYSSELKKLNDFLATQT